MTEPQHLLSQDELAAPWYHGSPLNLDHLKIGSTVTRQRHLAEVFSSKPTLVCLEDDGSIRHNGVMPGHLYRLAETPLPGDLVSHPHSSMDPGLEWLTTRELRLVRIEATRPNPHEQLSTEDIAALLAQTEERGDA